MRIAFLADIHANREALQAVLDHLADLSPDRIVLLGDIVGYGPDPEFAVEKAADLVDRGALCLNGNHDEAAIVGPRGMSANARAAMIWTRERLSAPHLRFLDRLPLIVRDGGRTYVHSSAHMPASWPYVRDAHDATLCLSSSDDQAIFCGHTHVPAIFYALPGRTPVHHSPPPNLAMPLIPSRRHVVVLGAVGQPRDGIPAACLGLLDTDKAEVTMVRVPYDFETTERKIQNAGLPPWLGMRLKLGR